MKKTKLDKNKLKEENDFFKLVLKKVKDFNFNLTDEFEFDSYSQFVNTSIEIEIKDEVIITIKCYISSDHDGFFAEIQASFSNEDNETNFTQKQINAIELVAEKELRTDNNL